MVPVPILCPKMPLAWSIRMPEMPRPSRNYSRAPHDMSEASGIGRVDGGFEAGFRNGLEVDVRGLSGGTGRLDQGP